MTTRMTQIPAVVGYGGVASGGFNAGTRNFRHQIKSTRWLLIGAFAALVVALGGLAFTGYATYSYYGNTLRLIGVNSGPSIIASSRMRTLMADASASAINAGLREGASHDLFLNQYSEAMDQVHASLISAALNITYGQEEREPLYQLMSALSDYERKIGVAWATQGPAATARLQEAAQALQERVLPEVAELEQVSLRNLRNAYERHRESGQKRSVELIVSGVAILSLIVLVQWLLVRRFRRILSWPLLAAVVVVAGYLMLVTSLTESTDEDLRAASQHSFERVHDLIGIKSAAFDARIEEGLTLLGGPIPVDELAFARASAMVQIAALMPAGQQAWSQYIALHKDVVHLKTSGRRDEAIAVGTGFEPGQSGWAFDQFIAALDTASFRQQNDFDDAITHAAQRLSRFPWLLLVTVLLMLVLIVLAIRPRLAEFRT